jgi:Protein of unknown function (DUF3108)
MNFLSLLCRLPRCHSCSGLFPAALFAVLSANCCSAAGWQSTVSKASPGDFPTPRSVRAAYRFGWAGLTAATAEVYFTKSSNNHDQLDGIGRTIGLARLLWKFDVNYCSIANATTLRPIEVKQTESYRSKTLFTHLVFNNAGVKRKRTEWPKDGKSKIREFDFPNLFDMHSALLYLRSQSLTNGSVYRVVVYPATSAYLVTLTVTGREKISIRTGTYNAIKLDLRLQKIGKHLELEPHRKFRRATIWVSDDANRLPLRAEAQVFIGTVFAELQSARLQSEELQQSSAPVPARGGGS